MRKTKQGPSKLVGHVYFHKRVTTALVLVQAAFSFLIYLIKRKTGVFEISLVHNAPESAFQIAYL